MAKIDPTITNQIAQPRGTDLLPNLSSPLVNACIKGDVAAHQAFDAHSAGDFRSAKQRLCVSGSQNGNGLHHMRAINESQPFFCMEMDGGQARLL